MQIAIRSLKPGDQMYDPGANRFTFVGVIDPHPLYPSCWLVITRNNVTNEWHHDALSPNMEVEVDDSDRRPSRLEHQLRWTLLGRV